MKTLISYLTIVFAFLTLANCTKDQSRNNQHQSAPRVEVGSTLTANASILTTGLQDLSTFRGDQSESLRNFFETYLTEDFFRNLVRLRDPKELRDLSQYHRQFHQYSLDHPENRDSLSLLSFDYYQRLVSLCANDFQTCPILGLYSHAVYAGNVFLLAEPHVPEAERERYILFTTNIGFPQNNIPIVERRLQWMVDDISDDETVDLTKIERLTNLIVYLSIEGHEFPQAPIHALYRLVQGHPNNTSLSQAFENILQFSLEREPNGPSLEIAERYILNILSSSNLDSTLQMENNNGLIRWKGELQTFSLARDWQSYYVLYGFLKPQYSGDLHSHFFAKAVESQEKQSQLLNISLAYIYKKFIKNAYLSHQEIGQIWQQEFERFGKVEPMFTDFFRLADAKLAEIWNAAYKQEVERISNEITPYFTAAELAPIKQVEDNLESNIANLVAYPAQFIAGYFASQQGDFDFKFFVGGGGMPPSIVHMNDIYYFKEHFDGSAPVMFQFVTEPDIKGLESLLSFYISLDQRILQSYNLNLEFTQQFIGRYLQKEKQFMLDKNEEMRRSLSDGTAIQRLKGYCEKIERGDFNFTYNLPFSASENRFFMGQVYPLGGGYTFGTNHELVDFINIFNKQLLPENLSETTEVLRMELDIKVNRMQLMRQALLAQSQTEIAEQIGIKIDEIQQMADDLYRQQEENFFEFASCLVSFEKVEKIMRLEYFDHEIHFAKATYQALNILNQDPNRDLSMADVRAEYDSAFANPFFQELPQAGRFVDGLNQTWLKYGRRFKQNIVDYDSQVTAQIGFKKTINSRYAFFTNKFEQRFRLIDFIRDSQKRGQEFPTTRINGLPRSYEELDLIFGEGQNHFFTLEKGTNETESQYVFKHFTHNGFRRSGYATQFLMDGTSVWKVLYLNMAALAKTKAHRISLGNFNYRNYPQLIGTALQPHFAKVARFNNELLSLLNISEQERSILIDLNSKNFRRDDETGAGGARQIGNTLFVYNNVVDFYNLGQFDVFFNVLSSYQLGKKAQFIPGLFGSGPQHDTGYDQNPLVWEWIPRVQSGGTGGPGPGMIVHVDADETFGRRNQRTYPKDNVEVAIDYDNANLFAVQASAKNLIFHDVFHTVMADRSLIDSFVQWTQNPEVSQSIQPYHLDLYFHAEPVTPPLIQPSIRDRYYDYRQQFDYETLNLFKDAGEPGVPESRH